MAAKNSAVRKPSATPTTTCSAELTISAAVSRSGRLPCRWGVIGREIATAIRALTGAGMIRELNGGHTTSHADARIAASISATRVAVGISQFIRVGRDSGGAEQG